MGNGRPELFPRDRGLQARMVFAVAAGALLTALYLAALLAACVALALVGVGGALFAVMFLVVLPAALLVTGWSNDRRAINPARFGGRQPYRVDTERLESTVHRLCVVADLPAPNTEVVGDGLPLSWTTARPGRTPCVHVSTAMLDSLPDREFDAVVAYELSHIAHRDAVVTTVVGGPSVQLLRGFRATFEDDRPRAVLGGLVTLHAAVPALVLAWLSRIVSRHRVRAADRSSALIVGSPAALASALVRVRDQMAAREVPEFFRDLSALRNQFYVVPVDEARGLRRLWATHPPLRERLTRLDEMEHTLQTARGQAGLILDSEAEPPPPPPPPRTATASGGSSPAPPGG